jgi:hypothetical protein
MATPLLSWLCLLPLVAPQDPTPAPTVLNLLAEARGELEAGRVEPARRAIERALERDALNFDALALSAAIADIEHDIDRATHDRFIWIELFDRRPKAQQDRKSRKATLDALLVLDEKAQAWETLQKRYVTGLVALAKEYQRNKDLLGAIDLWAHVLEVDPGRVDAERAIGEIRRTGGAEVAIEDLFAGAGDPTGCMSQSDLDADDQKHLEWTVEYTK